MELHQAGLIEMQRNGKQVECWVEPNELELLASFFKGQITEKEA
jgi:ArsR family transcriptional regulator